VHGQDRIDVTDRLNVILGIRGDWFLNHRSSALNGGAATILDTSFSKPTGQAGATYRLNNGWSLFGGYATGFSIESTASVLTFNGVPLDPETSWQTEAGVRYGQGSLTGSASWFQIERTNVVTTDPNHIGYSINNGNVRARGVELESKWTMNRNLFTQAGYAFIDSEVIKSNSGHLGFQVADMPRNRADFFVGYDMPRLPLQLRAGFNYVGDRAFADTANVTVGPSLLANTIRLPEYATLDLGATYTFGHARIDANLGNIANKTYYLRDFNNFSVISGEPRQFDARITYQFHDTPSHDITARVPAGTINFAAVLSIPTAVEFHYAVGGAAKEKHMRSLRDRWVNSVQDLKNVEICVPDDPARYCAIASFRLKGITRNEKAQHLQQVLFAKRRIPTVWRKVLQKDPSSELHRISTAPSTTAMHLRLNYTRNKRCSPKA
jgi:predicted porin